MRMALIGSFAIRKKNTQNPSPHGQIDHGQHLAIDEWGASLVTWRKAVGEAP